MFISSDDKYVEGDITGVAYSLGVPDKGPQLLIEKVKTGLDSENFLDKHAYGFFYLDDDIFVACHFQLMDLTERIPRGNPVFVDCMFISRDQLSEIKWKLNALFNLFENNIPYFSSPKTNLPPFELKPSPSLKKDSITFDPKFTTAILTELFDDTELPIHIIGLEGSAAKLLVACRIYEIVHAQLAEYVSFMTLGRPDKCTARIVFPTFRHRQEREINWESPQVQDKPGRGFAYWVFDHINDGHSRLFREKLDSLRLTNDGRSIGACLDLAVDYDCWIHSPENYNIRDEHSLQKNIDALEKFISLLTVEEREDWTSKIIVSSFQVSSFTIAQAFINHYKHLLDKNIFREKIIRLLIDEIYLKEGFGINFIRDFILASKDYDKPDKYKELLDFNIDLLLDCLRIDKSSLSLHLWLSVKEMQWLATTNHHHLVLATIPQLETKEQFYQLLDNLSIHLVNNLTFEKLSSLIKRSPKAEEQLLRTKAFLDCATHPNEICFSIEKFSEVFSEIDSTLWGLVITNYLLSSRWVNSVQFVNDLFKKKTKLALALFKEARHKNITKLSTLLGAGLIVEQISQGKSDITNTKKILSSLDQADLDDSVDAFEIMRPSLDILSDQQVDFLLDTYQKKKTQLMYESMKDIVYILARLSESRKRQETIKQLFKKTRKVSPEGALRTILFQLISAYDYQSWALLRELITNDNSKIYKKEILVVLANLDIKNSNEYYQFSKSLRTLGLNWEADILVFKLLAYTYNLPPLGFSEDFALALRSSLFSDENISAMHIGFIVDIHPVRKHKGALGSICQSIIAWNQDFATDLTNRIENKLEEQHPKAAWLFTLQTKFTEEAFEEKYIQLLKLTLDTMVKAFKVTTKH